MEEIFDGVYVFWHRTADSRTHIVTSVRERLKEVLRQYELRERHFECVIRSKELEVLLSRARAAEQKQLAEGQNSRVEKLEEQVRRAIDCCNANSVLKDITGKTAGQRARRHRRAARHTCRQITGLLS